MDNSGQAVNQTETTVQGAMPEAVPAAVPGVMPAAMPGVMPAAMPAPAPETPVVPEAPAMPEAMSAGAVAPEAMAGATAQLEMASVPGVVAQSEMVAQPGATEGGEKSLRIETLLEECARRKASDLHIQVGLPPILRVDGALIPIAGMSALKEDVIQKLIFSTLDSEQREVLSKDKEFDYSFAFGDVARFRVNAFQERGHLAAAFRLIPNKMPTLDELGLPQVVSNFASYPRGLVLVTGPTGSGKSTTLAALIDKINQEKSVHIITIEDPVEFAHRSKRSVIVQREIHYDTYSFARALKSVLRQDPDVVLLGEMRDLETMQSALTIAETGHLVFATLHTNSAAQSVDRIIDVFPAEQQQQIRMQLASVLMAVCSQRLIPAIGGGRIAACEIMVANTAVRSIIREGKTHQLDTAIQTGINEGMQTMDRTLAKMVQQGIITFDHALEYAVDPNELKRLTRG